MKKNIFFLLLCFLPIFVSAKEVLLKEISIENGELSLPFDSYNTEYTVTLGENEYQLQLSYEVEDGVIVSVNNNYDLENDSVVTLIVSREDSHLDYHFHILKEGEESVPTFKETVETKDGIMSKYKQYIIPLVCSFFVFVLYKIIFRKHKKKII